MKKLLLVGIAASLITGCQSMGRVGSPLWKATTPEADQIAYFRNTCLAYGFEANTPQLAQCISQERANADAAARERAANASRYYQSTRPINCTSIRTGTIVNTNCR